MGNNRTNKAFGQFLRYWNEHEVVGKTDGHLLGQFVHEGDEQAFAALVRRHGVMILGVCRRILGNAADADDAFQATLLVLVRKAKSLQSRALLGDWLHGVARRAAWKVKGASARRWTKEQAMARPEAQGEEPRNDWLPLLDEELSRLPEKYRLPIILCDLESRTRHEAARLLGWPEGTVAGRLARARALLLKRLVKRGVSLSLAALTAALSQKAVLATLPTALVTATIKAASLVAAGQFAAGGAISAKVAILTGEVMKTLLLSKLKTIAMVLVVCAVGGFGWIAVGGPGSEPAEAGATEKVPEKGPTKRAEKQKKEDKNQAIDDRRIVKSIATSKEVIANLQELIDVKEFQEDMTLKDALAKFQEKFQEKGMAMPVLIDVNSFRSSDLDAPNPYDTPVKFPSIPQRISAGLFLELAISQIPTQNAELQFRDGVVHITSLEALAATQNLTDNVFAIFENQPLADVVEALANKTGVTINLDPRTEEKGKLRITATFRNDVNLGGALRTVADMAGLKVVNMKSGLYITTPSNAAELERALDGIPTPPPAVRGGRTLPIEGAFLWANPWQLLGGTL